MIIILGTLKGTASPTPPLNGYAKKWSVSWCLTTSLAVPDSAHFGA